MKDLEKHWEELLVRIDERQKLCVDELEKINENLFGNGKEGLTTRMKKAEEQLIALEKHRLELKKTLMWFATFIIGAVSIIVAIINYFKI